MTFEEITGISKEINILDLGAKFYSINDQKYNNLSTYNICGIDYFPDERSISKNKKYYNHIINVVIIGSSSRKSYITEMKSCSSLNIYGSYDLALHCLKKSDADETIYKKFFFGLFQNEIN